MPLLRNNSPRAGNAITEKSIKRASLVFMGCSQFQFDLSPATVGRGQKQRALPRSSATHNWIIQLYHTFGIVYSENYRVCSKNDAERVASSVSPTGSSQTTARP